MKNLTKASREASRKSQFESLIKNGYTQETYKGLDFFTKPDAAFFTLKVYRGNAANHEEYKNYRTEERRAEVIQNYKNNYDSREAYKAKQKIENKGKSSSHAAAAAAMRTELKAAFLNIKFSVTSESFAGGDAVRVSWTDGPTTDEVNDIAKKYQYGHFNGMEDIYENTNSRDDIPQTKYVTTSRHQSEIIESILPSFEALFTEEQKTDWRNAPKQTFYRIFSKTSFPATYTNPRIETTGCHNDEYYKIAFDTEETPTETDNIAPVEVKKGGVSIIEYGKGLAVIGDTKPIKEQLKALGGRFNFRLTCGAGWVFSSDKLEAIKQMLLSVKGEAKEETAPLAIAQHSNELSFFDAVCAEIDA